MLKWLWLFVLVATFPMELWTELDTFQRWLLTQYVGATYCEKINPKCQEALITAFDGKDGKIYFDAICTKEKPVA